MGWGLDMLGDFMQVLGSGVGVADRLGGAQGGGRDGDGGRPLHVVGVRITSWVSEECVRISRVDSGFEELSRKAAAIKRQTMGKDLKRVRCASWIVKTVEGLLVKNGKLKRRKKGKNASPMNEHEAGHAIDRAKGMRREEKKRK